MLAWSAVASAVLAFAACLGGWLAGGGSVELAWAPTLDLRLDLAFDGLAALHELSDYCLYRIRECRRKPQDRPEAIHALARFELDGRRFSDEEAASHVTMLVIGGTGTYSSTTGSGTFVGSRTQELGGKVAATFDLGLH